MIRNVCQERFCKPKKMKNLEVFLFFSGRFRFSPGTSVIVDSPLRQSGAGLAHLRVVWALMCQVLLLRTRKSSLGSVSHHTEPLAKTLGDMAENSKGNFPSPFPLAAFPKGSWSRHLALSLFAGPLSPRHVVSFWLRAPPLPVSSFGEGRSCPHPRRPRR